MKIIGLAVVLAGISAVAAGAQSLPPTPTENSSATDARDVAVLAVNEPDRGGAPDDGDIWRRSLTVGVEGEPGVFVTKTVVANTPIPDSSENRRQFGRPSSASGRQTAPQPGPAEPS